MGLAATRRDKLLAVLDERIREGEEILASAKHIPGRAQQGMGGFENCTPARDILDFDRFAEWRSRSMSVAVQIVPPGNVHRQEVERFALMAPDIGRLRHILAKLRALRGDFAEGLLDDAWLLIRAEVAGDYMGQAETLLEDGYHVPAAVLAGAVLEDALRKLCAQHSIPTVNDKGAPKSVNGMNTNLHKKGLYNTAKMQEIQAWAGYRNDCAHGKGDNVKSDDVRRTIQGVRAFVADHLK